MKLAIENRALTGALKHVIGALEKRNTIPILANVLLIASENRISIKGTDLDVVLENSVAAEVESTGRITVPGDLLYNILKRLKPDVHVTIDSGDDKEGSQLKLAAGRSRFVLNTLPAGDFPELETKPTNHTFAVSAQDVAALFGRTRFSISTEETRYYLNGVYLHAPEVATGPCLRGVTTDGHRLAQVDRALPEGAAGIPGVIVPRKTVDLVLKMIDGQDQLMVSVCPTRIVFQGTSTTLTSKLIDGTFPDYQRVVPLGNDKTVHADRTDLLEAVDRLSTVSSERGRAIKLSFTSGKLALSIVNAEAGSADEEMDVEYEGEPLDIGFNSRYLCDILGEVAGKQVELLLADPGSPSLLKGVGDPSALFVQMPMRV